MEQQKGIKKRAKKLFATNNIAVAIIIIAAVLCVFAGVNAMQKNYDLSLEISAQAREKRKLEYEIAELEYQKIWRSSAEYQDLTLRTKLGVIADGEKIIELPDPSENIKNLAEKETQDEIDQITEKPTENWQIWLRFLLGK
ncbi:MAG: hypothetical protein LBM97_00255 [Candidatus Nomurabacteria bacterium]|jgi:cell division protein FtsB|nr:hypothetical protein [Candidatus Nomurabacteria bacterium]